MGDNDGSEQTKLEREFFRMLNRALLVPVPTPGFQKQKIVSNIMNDYLPFQRQLAFHAVIVLTLGMISGFIGATQWRTRGQRRPRALPGAWPT